MYNIHSIYACVDTITDVVVLDLVVIIVGTVVAVIGTVIVIVAIFVVERCCNWSCCYCC